MCQKLPVSGFTWRKTALTEREIKDWNPDGSKGYFVECDVHVDPKDHNHFNDLPPFPESIPIDESMVSYATRQAMERRGVSSVAPQKKLAPNLFIKKRYKVHIAALQYYLSIGGVLDKVHRVLEFNQSNWLSNYIQFNTSKRQQSTSEFGKAFYKLLNNAFFGKSMERWVEQL